MDGGYSTREEAGGGMTRSSMIYVLKAGSALFILSVNLDKLIKATKHRTFQRIISFVIEKVTFVIFKFFWGGDEKKKNFEGRAFSKLSLSFLFHQSNLLLCTN